MGLAHLKSSDTLYAHAQDTMGMVAGETTVWYPQIIVNNVRNMTVTRCDCKAGLRTLVNEDVQFKVAAADAGGDTLVGHTKRDHINFVNRLKMRAIEGGDAATLINLLTQRQSEDPVFFFRVQFNKEGRLCHPFLCDSMMREDYLLYHDVLIFDTTFTQEADIGYANGIFNRMLSRTFEV
ncbi:hypothetical protein KSS87_014396 [Heliosperma pusillum]|nr:hypothetical protein KSS87_014396 [Heliosperma pusillum]